MSSSQEGRVLTVSLLVAMLGTQFRSHGFELDLFLEKFVVAVPLDEIGAAHEGAVLGGAAIVVPKVEEEEVDRLLEGLRAEDAIFAEASDELLGLLDFFVGRSNDGLGLCVNAIDENFRVALVAHGLHGDLSDEVVGALLSDGIGEVVGKALARIVGDFLAVETGHVACGASWDKHIARGKRFRIDAEI